MNNCTNSETFQVHATQLLYGGVRSPRVISPIRSGTFQAALHLPRTAIVCRAGPDRRVAKREHPERCTETSWE